MCTVVAEVNVYIAVQFECIALRTLGTGHSCAAKRIGQWICMFAHGYHDKEYRSLLRSVTLSPPSKWLSMAPKAMQPTGLKKVQKPAKAMQKNKAKVHNVQKKPSQAQTQESFLEMGDVIEEDQEEEQHEEQQHEQEGECQEHEDETAEKDKSKVSGKGILPLLEKMPEAPKAVQEQVQKIKDQPHRSGKQKQLAEMAKAYASQKWDHKLFKSIESLQQERSKAREDIVMPKVIMVAKCGGKAPFEQATCLVNCTMSYHDVFAFSCTRLSIAIA